VSQSSTEGSNHRVPKILVAEDEELVLALFQAILKKAGFDLVCASTGNQAASFFDAAHDTFDLLITDLSLPGMNGETLAAHVRNARPDIKLIFSTGSITDEPQKAIQRFNGAIFLPKPFGFEELVTIVNKALEIPGV
jgi:two-component system cell cycle sensor histidine kinase/response regulator CckA